MVKVYCTTTAGRSCELFEDDTKIKDVFKFFGADYTVATNTIECVRLTKEDLEKTLSEMNVGAECHLSSIVKIDNAAHIGVSGAAAILVSDIDLKDWKRVEKYSPDSLKLYDEEGYADFIVKTSDSQTGSVGEHGVTFSSYSNKNGKATVTILLNTENEDKVAAVKELFGNILLDLNQIEEGIPEILKSIADKEAEIDKLVTEA